MDPRPASPAAVSAFDLLRGFPLNRARKYFLTVAISMLAATILLKLGEIQYLELLLALDFLVVVTIFFKDGLQTAIYRPYLRIGCYYAVFAIGAILLSMIALQQQTFYSFDDSALKKPLIVTLSRVAELFLDVFYMLYMAHIYREDQRLCRLGMITYYWTAVAACFYSVFSFPANYFFESQLGTYANLHRFRGFLNEGGPFGMYLISVCMVTGALYQREWISKRKFHWGMTIFAVCFLGSQSKSAFFAALLVVSIDLMWKLHGWKLISMFAVAALAAVIVGNIIDIREKIDVVVRGSATYQQSAYLRPTDGNIIMGRVAGAVLAPRMIAAHPLAGIGWGNYALVRNDPPYRQGTPFSLGSLDSPSLGVLDYLVELGFPLFFFLCWTELQPLLILRRHHANFWVVNMAMIQPLSNWFGAHLNLTYPWVVVGFALGLGYSQTKSESAALAHPDVPA